MSAAALPDFEHTVQVGQGILDTAGLAECHGVLCGLVCRKSGGTPSEFLNYLKEIHLLVNPGTALAAALSDAFDKTAQQLVDEDMGFELWLPDDDESLEDRTVALAQWCSGFLAGLGSSGDDTLKAMSDEANDALKDMQQISTADVSDTDESEEDENAFVEVVEYIRVVILMIREDLRGPDEQDLIH